MPFDLIIPHKRNYDLKDGATRRCFLLSPKSADGRPFWLQSLAMALYVREKDIDAEVATISSEPGVIYVYIDGKKRKYHPDFCVTWRRFNRRPTIVEIKSAARRHDAALLERFKHVEEACLKAEHDFELIFSDRLYRQPKRRNVALIHYYMDWPVTERELDLALQVLGTREDMTIGEIVATCPILTPQKLYALTAKGYLWVNLFKPVDHQAFIRVRRSLKLAQAA
jgi:hypothetical protein